MDLAWFRRALADRCAGVWMYLRYVLDEIRDGARDPRGVDRLPGDLAGYYAEQVEHWRRAAAAQGTPRGWEEVCLPLLGVLAAARAPLTVQELASFAGVWSQEAARAFVEETARAFLGCHHDQAGQARYAVRHQSLRDLLTGTVPSGRPDLVNSGWRVRHPGAPVAPEDRYSPDPAGCGRRKRVA